jgi:hypothetical protein
MVNLNKKNKRGGGDFEKAKFKVGKIKAGAVNATDTSFTAKRLCLREQQLSTAQKVEAFTKGTGLAIGSLAAQLKPTLGQTGHYNVNMRKDAYGMLLKKIKSSEEAAEVVGILLEHSSRGMVDEEGSVRGVVLALTAWIFEKHNNSVIAFFDGWVQFLLLALLHLHEDIRRDALRFLEIALKHAKTLVVAHSGKILAALSDSNLGKRMNSRGKGPDAVNIALELIDSYVTAKAAPKFSAPIIYAWQPIQRASMRGSIIRKRPQGNLTLGDIPIEDYAKTVKWMGDRMIDDWLEAIPVMATVTKPTPMERAAHSRVVNLAKRLAAFSTASGYDTTSFTEHLPPAIRNHKALKCIIDDL